MNTKKLAVIFPGMGYHKDKPLLYYSGKLAVSKGYEVIALEYTHFFEGIKFTDEEKEKASAQAYEETEKVLAGVRFAEYDSVVFIGKSLGTIFAARFASEHKISVHHIWYTPIMSTFSFGERSAVAFLGTKDPLSSPDEMGRACKEFGIPFYTYKDGNHSIETGDVIKDTEYIHEIMKVTNECLN